MDNITLDFNVALKKFQQEGNLAWEYNPFRNYRLNQDMILYNNKFYTIEEFEEKFNVESIQDLIKTGEWDQKIFQDSTPEFYQKNSIVDFITNELSFDLNHPVQITPTYSYDNSVDLIINDGNSYPKIINSRFSPIGRNKYQIVDRVGDNDTNIYDSGDKFANQTSLYKTTSTIPELTFSGLDSSGNMKIGNYFFYFKYCDADGNESDFIAESGLVSIFVGNSPQSIHSGFRDQNSHKKVKFLIENTDNSYQDLVIYYTRATSDIYENATIEAHKILQKFKIVPNKTNQIIITGFENTQEIALSEINLFHQIYDSVKTQAVSQNILFLGNVSQQKQNKEYLSQLALTIIPELDITEKCEVTKLSDQYNGSIINTYYNPKYIYYKVGYWPDELYRFGIVFIFNNNTLSDVYNIRGRDLSQPIENLRKELPLYDEYTFEIKVENRSNEADKLENAKGVCYFPHCEDINTVYGVRFHIPEGIKEELQKFNIQGFFLVRQKRIPTTLCQAYTIEVENNSHIPVLPTFKNNSIKYIWESFVNNKKQAYTYYDEGSKEEGEGYLLTHKFNEHKREIEKIFLSPSGAICPDYDVNSPYLNSLFTGASFKIHVDHSGFYPKESSSNNRLFHAKITDSLNIDQQYQEVKIVGVEDGAKLVAIGDQMFSARAGEAEEAFRFEFVESEYKQDNGGNKVVRGIFGPYLGIVGLQKSAQLISIKIPDYSFTNMKDYFSIRYYDEAPFYSISDRYSLDSIKLKFNGDNIEVPTCYRGDCYISNFTHRINRNFIGSNTPTNNDIVDPKCWTHNMEYEDQVLKAEKLSDINLGDINAVNLGMWVTIPIRSNINHSIRSLNGSNTDETLLFGHERGFYPYLPCNARSAYKTQESDSYNKGFEKGLSEQYRIQLPRVPYYQDLFPNRIVYSNIKINNFFQNSFRIFEGTHYRDYPLTYGSITKIIEFSGDLICVLEHGIYKIPINERAIAAEGSGGFAYINTSNVLPENPQVLSDTYGSQWIDSIIKTPSGIYGVDTIAKKIWKIDNYGKFRLLSDWHIQEFLNNNITLTERELTPIMGIRNVKTHYDNFKHDVIFTFYDDVYGYEDKCWSICYNEVLELWVTFYSWIPSFSENIYNQFFSFNRETSKHIAKLGFSANKNWSEGIYLDNVIMQKKSGRIGKINIRDVQYQGTNITTNNTIILESDVYKNNLKFKIEDGTLIYLEDYNNYVLKIEDIKEVIVQNKIYRLLEFPSISGENKLYWADEYGIEVSDKTILQAIKLARKYALKESVKNSGKQLVYYLNVKIQSTVEYSGTDLSYEEYIADRNLVRELTGRPQEYTIAVIPEEHLELLTTDFWKHGQSGIIDITDEIKPTYWYGKQHPFEFEFVVNTTPTMHKIFDNLKIISNKAEPESFHYEIVGDCYEFAEDKKNMYIRQEAVKRIFQDNGSTITYDRNYTELIPYKNIKSAYFPLYYTRRDDFNLVEDYYHLKNGDNRNFAHLSGSEITFYKNLNEYRIWCHTKASDINKNGRLHGNMQYKEDVWNVQINPINLQYFNDSFPCPLRIPYNSIPEEIIKQGDIKISEDIKNDIIVEDAKIDQIKEVKIKDKWIKIRVRYSGEQLAIITAIQTLFSLSFS